MLQGYERKVGNKRLLNTKVKMFNDILPVLRDKHNDNVRNKVNSQPSFGVTKITLDLHERINLEYEKKKSRIEIKKEKLIIDIKDIENNKGIGLGIFNIPPKTITCNVNLSVNELSSTIALSTSSSTKANPASKTSNNQLSAIRNSFFNLD